jgi:hypothetical protein
MIRSTIGRNKPKTALNVPADWEMTFRFSFRCFMQATVMFMSLTPRAQETFASSAPAAESSS